MSLTNVMGISVVLVIAGALAWAVTGEEPAPTYKALSFDEMTKFDYPFPPKNDTRTSADREKQIPADIKALAGTRVSIRGYMLPLVQDEKGGVTEFYIWRKMFTCCFGDFPKVTEVVESYMPEGKSTPHYEHVPVIVQGVLHVRESLDSGGLNSIYQLREVEVLDPGTASSDHVIPSAPDPDEADKVIGEE